MTAQELLSALLTIPASGRDMPVVITLIDSAEAVTFHEWGEDNMTVDADGEFVSIVAHRSGPECHGRIMVSPDKVEGA
jgi:hypothetical protein